MEAIESNTASLAIQPGAASLPALMAGQAIDFAHLSPETAITLKSAGRDYVLTAHDLIKWTCPGVPVHEAVKLLVTAQNLGLNPLFGEIELINFGGKWTVSIRKNGYVRIGGRDPNYDGHESGIVIQPADYSKPPQDIAGTLTPRGWVIVGGWCKVYRKGISRPIYKRVSLDDYDRNTGTWKTNPAVMIEKVPIAQAFREACPIGEHYDESEMPVQREATISNEAIESASRPAQAIIAQTPEVIPASTPVASISAPASDSANVPVIPGFDVVDVEVVPTEPQDEPCTIDQQAQINTLVAKLNMNTSTYNKMLSSRGREKLEDLTRFEALQIITKLLEKTEYKTLAS